MTDKQYGAPEIEQPKRKPKRSWLQRTLWIAGPLVVLLIAGWIWVTSGRYMATENAYVGAEIAFIAPQVGGQVIEVEVRQNQQVQKGDVLFRIDATPYQLAVDALKARLHGVGNLLASTRKTFAAAEATLRSQQSNLDNAQAQLERIRDLHKKGLVSQKMLDDAINDVAEARGERDAAAANAAKARAMLGGDVEAPLTEMAGYKSFKAQLASARLDLANTVVRAPFDGIIGKTNVQKGDYLRPGEKVMPLIGSRHWVDANFKETALTHVAVGQQATITLDTYPDYTWHAEVLSISPATGATYSILPAQNATGNWVKVVQRIPVRLVFTNNEGHPTARVGMSAEVEIDTGADNSIWGSWFGDDSTRPTDAAKTLTTRNPDNHG